METQKPLSLDEMLKLAEKVEKWEQHGRIDDLTYWGHIGSVDLSVGIGLSSFLNVILYKTGRICAYDRDSIGSSGLLGEAYSRQVTTLYRSLQEKYSDEYSNKKNEQLKKARENLRQDRVLLD